MGKSDEPQNIEDIFSFFRKIFFEDSAGMLPFVDFVLLLDRGWKQIDAHAFSNYSNTFKFA